MEFTAELSLAMASAATATFVDLAHGRGNAGLEDKVDPNGVVPADIVRFLARLRLLEGVPFNHLVPDAAMLPLETIRFFHVDRNWLDALVQGALSVGTVNSADREQLVALHPVVRREVDVAERLVRMKDADAPAVDAQGRPLGVAGVMTGFLMRSRIVSGWPALHVRAYATDTRPDDATLPDQDTSPDRVRLLRMERLAPAVLLVLFDGVPAVVHVEEPRSGIQFGVRVKPGAGGTASAVLPLRDVLAPNNRFLKDANGKDRTVPVPFRKGAPGVINVHELARRLANVSATHVTSHGGSRVSADELAMELLRFPIRQVFGDVDVSAEDDSFVPTLKTSVLVERFSLAQRVLEA